MISLGPDSFYSAKLRIERAAEHVEKLKAEIDEFFAENPYTRVAEPDSDGVHDIYKLKVSKRFPLRWRVWATEIIEHLRASLDHATWAAAYLSTGIADIEQAAFPFAATAADLENSIRRRSKNVPAEILTVLRRFKPYEGGNRTLFILNDLCNLSKHALVAFVAGATAYHEIGGLKVGEPFELYDPVWDREKNEIKYARVKRGADFQHEFRVGVYIALQYREHTSTEPAIEALREMGSEVERIVEAIETESRKIGLLE